MRTTHSKRKLIVIVLLLLIAGAWWYLTDGGRQLEAPSGTPRVQAVPTDWPAVQAERTKAIASHLQAHQSAYDHFANFPVSETDGIPFIILKLLPVVAPDIWQGGDHFLNEIGLRYDERQQGYPAPRGIGFSGLMRKEAQGNIDYASFTCGACHIGRLRHPDGHIQYLDGGINAEFNVIRFRAKLVQTLQQIYKGETDPEKKAQLVREAFNGALEKVQQDKNFFYGNYSYTGRNFDTAYEQAQVALFKQRAPQVIPAFIQNSEEVYAGWQLLVDRLYPGSAKQELLLGYAGTEDAIGFNAVRTYFGFRKDWYTRPIASLALPDHAGITDIMAVWNQDLHNPRWDASNTRLIDGGGQWNGHIPLPIFKNIAAQITIGFNDIDVRVSAFADELLDKLPAPAYPFPVDVKLAEKGKVLFAENCAACHQPNNGKVYRNLGTDMGRAKIAGLLITLGAQSGFTKVCSPKTSGVLDMSGPGAKDCVEYKGVSLEGKSTQAMTWPAQHDGYNALPLVGLWAQAPYLHNGSVPTLYHMLMPKERPAKFIKSRLDYDPEKVGFSWDPAKSSHSPTEGYLLDTTATPALSNAGHDKDITMDGKTFKLDWSDDKAGAAALIEYLKTM